MSLERPGILIVDDNPANLRLLSGMLKERGYKVRPVPSGPEALQAAQRVPPDLILLDINMPGMNGYEVCQRLKADPKLTDIPVLFISALAETSEKIKAFDAGGVDYVTKPFELNEVLVRVQTHLELRRQKRALEANCERLRELEQLRDNLTHMIVHDLRSPLTAIICSLDLLNLELGSPNPEVANLVQTARSNSSRLSEMVTQLLDISRLEAGKLPLRRSPCDLVKVARETLDSLSALAEARRLILSAPKPVTPVCDADLIRRVLGNLVANALKFTMKSGVIKLSISVVNHATRVEVTDDGPGIAPEHHQRIFEKFGQAEGMNSQHGTGLGLTFCKLAVEAHGGQIGVQSELGQGAVFWFTLPGVSPAALKGGSQPPPGV